MSLSFTLCLDALGLSATSISGNSLRVEGTRFACTTDRTVSVPASRHHLTRTFWFLAAIEVWRVSYCAFSSEHRAT